MSNNSVRKEVVESWFQADLAVNTESFMHNIKGWFEGQPTVGTPEQPEAWFLAHTESGVIWGRIDQGRLVLSSEQDFADKDAYIIKPTLAFHTFWEARLFGAAGQVHVWRTDAGVAGCRINEIDRPAATECFAFEESYRLWGTDQLATKNDFTLMCEGQQELRQAVPISVSKANFRENRARGLRPASLRVRSYVAFDENGVTTIQANRLVGLSIA